MNTKSQRNNPFSLKIGDRVIVDKEFRNNSEAVIQSLTPNELFATVKSDDGDQWTLMTDRLSPITI